MALWTIETTPEMLGKRVTLYIDNQSIIMVMMSLKASPGQYLINSLRMMANNTGCLLTIRWISGHSKVKGNEDVNLLAKEAAEGRSTAIANLPHILRHHLLVSTSALKQDFNTSLKARWSKMWDTSLRKPRITQLGGSFLFSAFLNSLSLLTRKQSSLILQLQFGHFPLNIYLHKINKVDSNRCQACDEEGISPPETINHFIFECPAHNIAREELIAKIGINNLHLSDIMAHTDRMKALVTFINRTRRLRG